MISIVNKRHQFYCGRGSPLGNNYTHIQDKQTKAEFVVGSRAESIQLYRTYLHDKIANKDKIVCDELNKIYKVAINYDIQLVCYCAGFHDDCHCDVIKEVILEKLLAKRI